MTLSLVNIVEKYIDKFDALTFSAPVTHTYNPLNYAYNATCEYLDRYGQSPKEVLFLGMNPGPFGMAQTGVPFGEVAMVRDWLKIEAPVGKPSVEHPSRPIDGFACSRSEPSGKRLWGLFAEQFGDADLFFKDHFVWNYCPLLWSEIRQTKIGLRARNITPDKLIKSERVKAEVLSDAMLKEIIDFLEPKKCIGVGLYAKNKLIDMGIEEERIGHILHPSPANPMANKGFAEIARKQLIELGVW